MSRPWFVRLSWTWLSFRWSSQVSPWTYRTSMCAPCSPRTSTISSDTRAPSPRRPATRASSGPCSIHPSLSHTTRYSRQDSLYLSGYSCYLRTVTVTVFKETSLFWVLCGFSSCLLCSDQETGEHSDGHWQQDPVEWLPHCPASQRPGGGVFFPATPWERKCVTCWDIVITQHSNIIYSSELSWGMTKPWV